MRWLAIIFISFGFASPVGATEWYLGPARVVDGDTIQLFEQKIRVLGIDAPESWQTCATGQGEIWACGKAATNYLKNVVGSNLVYCEGDTFGRYDRLIAICTVNGVDIGRDMVENGLAIAYVSYDRIYAETETRARALNVGIFSGTFTRPEKARSNRIAANIGPDVVPDTNCAIKGNISENGQIYHQPGTRWYDRTRISENRGERWFCTVAEAVAAGWRAPRG